MRHSRIAITLAAVSLSLGGCAALGLGETPGDSSAASTAGEPWMLVEAGKATPSPAPSRGRSLTPSPDPSLSAPALDPACTRIWPRTESAFIPIEVTPGAGTLKVEWPAQFDSNYRLAAVPQALISGKQPEPVWQSVAAGSGCSVTATITGLTSGKAYIVWLDAPNTGRERDGTRHLYSGRSGVVYPQ
ncbi:hypothetical protein [Actinoplanes sp. GCM10030250]|uniref:hypothetical protein n=1 Tax=Actinoplanes sp. GCM10030250 TaxID=3273376 RepID=UPI00360E3EDB